jgi:hypothetical protein
MFQQEELYQRSLSGLLLSPKFIRRADISLDLRIKIACSLMIQKNYGRVTNLAKEYDISRQFIYDLKKQLKSNIVHILGVKESYEEPARKEDLSEIRAILSLRLEGKCPIIGISQLLKRKQKTNSSIGYISQELQKIGAQIRPYLNPGSGKPYRLVFASDEIFSGSKPVLITVDPVSSAILNMELSKDRKSPSWQKHWAKILDGNIQAISRQSDSFHAIAHRLGDIKRILWQKTCGIIGEEYKWEQSKSFNNWGVPYRLQNKKRNLIKAEQVIKYQNARAKAKDFIDLYDSFSFWYGSMIEQLQIFDKKGKLRERNKAEQNLKFAMQQLQALNYYSESRQKKVDKEIKTIEGLFDDLFYFLDYAKSIIQPFMDSVKSDNDKQAIEAICFAYQACKNRKKAKKSKAKKYFANQEQESLLHAEILLESSQEDFETLHKELYKQLSTIIQSSAMVETINSIVRSYFNRSKNQITQEQLNLIMFYHNHRRYVQGERKGCTPMELLTGEKQEKDWLDLLLERTKKKAA